MGLIINLCKWSIFIFRNTHCKKAIPELPSDHSPKHPGQYKQGKEKIELATENLFFQSAGSFE